MDKNLFNNSKMLDGLNWKNWCFYAYFYHDVAQSKTKQILCGRSSLLNLRTLDTVFVTYNIISAIISHASYLFIGQCLVLLATFLNI